jgi:D-glycero-alpha-D-manno-heptose 1-phosphate guanylyltransferase
MQAIILAGGLGTRLKSVVADKPKVLSPVLQKPFLDYIIQYLKHQGVTSFVFSLGYLANQVIDFLKENYPDLNYQIAIEEIPLGTGGGIKNAMELASEENIFIINADTFFDVPLQTMMQFHIQNNADCTIALKQMNNYDRYGTVVLDESDAIVSFKEKKFTDNGLINGGYLIFNQSFYKRATQNLPATFSYEKDVLEKNIESMVIKGFISNGYFIDIGIPEDYLKAQEVFKNFTSNII